MVPEEGLGQIEAAVDVLLQERLEEVVNNLSGNNREVCNIDRSDRCQYQIQIKEKSVKNLLVDAWEIL